MTSGAIIALFFIVLLVLMLSGMPIAYSLGIASAGYMLMSGTSLAMMAQRMVNGANSFTMLAIPFFFMAGELMNISGVTDKIINMAKALVGHFKGGLAQVNIVASVFFAGVSGSATADTAALGSTLIPKMVEEGYDRTSPPPSPWLPPAWAPSFLPASPWCCTASWPVRTWASC